MQPGSSWKTALLITLAVTAIMGASRIWRDEDRYGRYKNPEIQADIPPRQDSQLWGSEISRRGETFAGINAGGSPPNEFLDREIIAPPNYLYVGYSVRALADYIRSSGLSVSWDHVQGQTLILRVRGHEQLTRQPVDTAFRMRSVNNFNDVVGSPGNVERPGVLVEQMAEHGVVSHPAALYHLLHTLTAEIQHKAGRLRAPEPLANDARAWLGGNRK